MSLTATPPSAAGLTGIALWLLDIPFEPASAAAGELFDRVVEHVSTELSRAALAVETGRPWQPPVLGLPTTEPARRRRDQLLLRRTVLSGRHPAETASMREAEVRLRQAVTELTQTRRLLTEEVAHHVAVASALLSALVRVTEVYRRSSIRLQRSIVAVDPDLPRQAGLAARAERDLVRRIRQAVHATYGLHETSGTV